MRHGLISHQKNRVTSRVQPAPRHLRPADRVSRRFLTSEFSALTLEARQLLTVSALKATLIPQIVYPVTGQYVPITIAGSYRTGPNDPPAQANFQVVDEYREVQPHGNVKSFPVPGSPGLYTFSFRTYLQSEVASGDSDGRLYTVAMSARQSNNSVGNSYGIWIPPQGYHPTTVVPQAHNALKLSNRGRMRAN